MFVNNAQQESITKESMHRDGYSSTAIAAISLCEIMAYISGVILQHLAFWNMCCSISHNINITSWYDVC
jgi:hypothetical protein